MNRIEFAAKKMAEAVNGGKWEKDYTESQKKGWISKIEWALKNLKLTVDVKGE